MPPSNLTPEQKTRLLELAAQGYTYSAISGLLGVPLSTVSYTARRAGIERGQGRRPVDRTPRPPGRFDHTRPATYWWDDAACAGMDLNTFYPTRGDEATTREAQQVCGGCPVRAECLADALSRPFEDGIWGGLTGRDRLELRARTA